MIQAYKGLQVYKRAFNWQRIFLGYPEIFQKKQSSRQNTLKLYQNWISYEK